MRWFYVYNDIDRYCGLKSFILYGDGKFSYGTPRNLLPSSLCVAGKENYIRSTSMSSWEELSIFLKPCITFCCNLYTLALIREKTNPWNLLEIRFPSSSLKISCCGGHAMSAERLFWNLCLDRDQLGIFQSHNPVGESLMKAYCRSSILASRTSWLCWFPKECKLFAWAAESSAPTELGQFWNWSSVDEPLKCHCFWLQYWHGASCAPLPCLKSWSISLLSKLSRLVGAGDVLGICSLCWLGCWICISDVVIPYGTYLKPWYPTLCFE